MDTIALYKSRIDALMDLIYGSGQANHAAIIEQLNYLLFLRALSIKDDEAELLGITDESEKIFIGDLAKYRWPNLLTLNPEDLFKTLEQAFEFLQKKSSNSTVRLLFRNAHVKIYDRPTLRRVVHEIEEFAKELDKAAHGGDKDVFGDMYEYLLSKLSSAGTNGQFRTPRHIIDFMVRVVEPKKNETILDPACGTAGFLVAAYRYIASQYTSDKLKKAGSPRAMDKLSADERNFLLNHMFNGFDSDEDMIKFGMMNLHLHGLTKPRLVRQNSLTDTTGMKDKFDVILANPPFAGKIDEESVSEDLRMGTKATELLFLRFMMDHLSLKGKLAVIVPEGVVSSTSKAHTKIREMLLEKGLWAVVSLPNGVFNPYAGVKTSLLFLDKEITKSKDEILFVKIENDGFDLGAQRRPIDRDDIPSVLGALNAWKIGVKTDLKNLFYIEKSKIKSENNISLNVAHYRSTTESSSSKWSEVSLGDENYFEVVSGGTPSTKKAQYWGGNIRWATLVDLPADQLISELTDTARKITPEGLKESSAILLPENSVIVSTRATIGRIAINRIPTATNQGFKNLIIKSKDILPEYVALAITKLIPDMEMQATGGTFKELSGSKFKALSIPLPPLEVQKQIIDELDRYQKVILGAKQIVVNWKPEIEIDPVWKMVKLGEVCSFEYGQAMPQKNREAGDYPVVGSNGIVGTHKDFIAQGPVIIVGRKGSAGEVNWIDQNCFPIDTTYYVRNKATEVLDYKFLYYILMNAGLQSLRSGGAVPGLNRNDAYLKQVPLPPLKIQKEIVEKIEKESKSVEAAKKLAPIFEHKIKDRIAKLWK